jgi:hypothetical protein
MGRKLGSKDTKPRVRRTKAQMAEVRGVTPVEVEWKPGDPRDFVESSPEDVTMEIPVGSDNDVVNETPEVGQA